MKLVNNFTEALEALRAQEGLTLILGDWDDGLKLEEGLMGEKAIEKILAAKDKYGERFSWRTFCRKIDVWWNGEVAVICEGEPLQKISKKLFLETDYRRFPGVSMFWDAEFSEPRYTRAVVEEFRLGNRVVHLRLLGLFKEEERNGSGI